ncbi:SIMPL domain-containing protein [Candidatus Kaiserbacteria bacterium]|nr:SIMPL domain-containing protein [Candidatus Kaiserbacteria bacterium]
MQPSFHDWAGDKRLKGLVFVVLALGALALVSYAYYAYKSSQYIYTGPTTISVRGVGEVTRVPDIAMFTFSVQAEAENPEAAQKKSADAVNLITAYLKENGVAEADYKTVNYSLYPRYRDMPVVSSTAPGLPMMEIMPPGYDYTESTVVGYTADQAIEVKVRDTAKAGALIAGVGERGATNVSGLRFTLDDDSDAKAEARAEAVADAKKKALQLADTLGVRLTRLSGFWEEDGGGYPMYDQAYGAEASAPKAMAVPDIPPGENTITSAVNLTYEIR